MCVCVYVCVHARTCVCMHARVCVCVCNNRNIRACCLHNTLHVAAGAVALSALVLQPLCFRLSTATPSFLQSGRIPAHNHIPISSAGLSPATQPSNISADEPAKYYAFHILI